MPNQFLSPEGDLETFNYFVTEYWLIDQWVGDTLRGWGNNQYAQLGLGFSSTSVNSPVTTSGGGTNWKQVSAGGFISSGIKSDGTLWMWSANIAFGSMGNNNGATNNAPVTTFAGGTNWKQVDCGYFHTAAIKTDGTLWTWGLNYSGNIGDNTTTNRVTPVTTFAGGTNWKQVACTNFNIGTRDTAAIKTDGTLWVWGINYIGQLGINATGARYTPVTTFAGGNNWKQVAGGFHKFAAIKTDGTLWVWGNNSNGQLGDNTIINRATPVTTFAGGTNWKQVSCGYGHVAAIKTDGTLWLWGLNSYGQLGTNNTITRSTPVTTFAGGTDWKQVSCGGFHTSAVKTDGTLWTWGRNDFAMLGTNNTTNRVTPVTTFAGGTNWKQVDSGLYHCLSVTSGTDPTFFIA